MKLNKILCAVLACILIVMSVTLYMVAMKLTELNNRINYMTDCVGSMQEKTSLQCVQIAVDGKAYHDVKELTDKGWLDYLKEVPAECTVSNIDMDMFEYSLVEEIGELDIENGASSIFAPQNEVVQVDYYRGVSRNLSYDQNPDFQAQDIVSVKFGETELSIPNARNAKKVYGYCARTNSLELLVVTIGDNLYAINEAGQVYLVTAR